MELATEVMIAKDLVNILPGMPWVLQTLVHCVMEVVSAYMISFVDLLLFPFDDFWEMCGESSCNVFLLLFVVLWVPIFATLCRRAVLMVWHAFLFLGLRYFPLLFFFRDQSTSAVEQQVVVLLSRAGYPATLTHIHSSMR
jgi:hypothetical protein